MNTRTIFNFVTAGALLALCTASPAQDAGQKIPAIVRKPLLTAVIDGEKNVSRVEIKEINFQPHQQTGLHLHPCPVVGYIVEGEVLFQVDGQPAQKLKAGDAFFEPANTKMIHFDALDKPTKFVAYYLLGKDDHEIIHMLDPK